MEHGPLDWKSYTTIAITAVALVLMVNDAPPDLAMLGVSSRRHPNVFFPPPYSVLWGADLGLGGGST